MKMLRYEIKKVFSKSKNRIAVIVLFVILAITSILTINRVEYVDENGNLCGDVDTASVQDKVSMITPVPAGVGSVTTSILAKHVVKACKNQNNK